MLFRDQDEGLGAGGQCTRAQQQYGGSVGGEPSWQLMDTLTTRLSYFGQKEEYKLVLINNTATNQDYRAVPFSQSAVQLIIDKNAGQKKTVHFVFPDDGRYIQWTVFWIDWEGVSRNWTCHP